MKVSRVSTKNFRSISQTSFNLSNTVTAIAGGNESGKSNALKAIEYFLSDEDFSDADQYQLSDKETEIEITFDNFNDEEKENISWALRRENVEEITIKRIGKKYSIVDDQLQAILDEETKSATESEEEITDEETESVAEEEEDKPSSIDDVTKYILEYLPECELISDISSLIVGDDILIEKIFAETFSTTEEENKYLTIRALLKIGGVTKQDLLTPSISQRIQILRKKSAIIASKIKSAWSQEDVKLQLMADNKNLVIHFRDGKNIPEGDREDDTKWIWTLPEDRSFGFRWYVTFYAKYLSRIQNTDDEDIVFLIDDAGLGLNKTAQIDLLGEFNKIANTIEKNDQVSKQVIYVSHSKYMFDWDMRKQILVANKQNGKGTIIEDFWWEKFSRNNLPAPLNELGVNWLEDLLQEKNLIVEGHSDGYIINYLLTIFSEQLSEELQISDFLAGFKIIPGNTPQGQMRLADLSIADNRKCLLLFDSDPAGQGGTQGVANRNANRNTTRYESNEIGELTESPINGKNFITIEDLLPVEKITEALNIRGKEKFSDNWEHISRLHSPHVNSLGVVKAIEQRLEQVFSEDDVSSFMKGKYFFILEAINNTSKEAFDEDQVEMVRTFFRNLNTKLVQIG